MVPGAGPIPGFFVYGTLMRGHLRERRWPAKPLAVLAATVQGRLYDLGPYPGLLPGEGTVAGEYWEFAPVDVPLVQETLDAVEGYQGAQRDLYRRRLIECQLDDGSSRPAHTYLYAGPLLDARPIPPGPDGICRWTRPVGQEG